MVASQPGLRWQEQLHRYQTPLIIAVSTFALGILFGVMAVGTLTPADKASLVAYLHRFIAGQASTPEGSSLFSRAVVDNLKVLGLLYVLGISVAGMPLVALVVFFRGFVLGFAMGFVTTTMAWQGVWFGVVVVGLQSVFMVPATMLVAAGALGFSWSLVAPRSTTVRHSVLEQFVGLTFLVVAMGAVVVVGSACETLVAPFLVHLLRNWGI